VDKDDDRDLVEACRRGDRAAFTVLAKRYQRPLYNAAYRLLGNVEDANDITQDVFVRVLERLDDYDPKYRFFSWIYRIAINESINALRRKGREGPMDEAMLKGHPGGADPESDVQNSQRLDRVQAALMRLRSQDRVVLTLRHFSDCSYQDMAEVLDLEEKTVKSRLFEARQRLSALLEPGGRDLI
jgi:RNA polymerase sigma-70 factor, ECF subfamily